MLPNITLMMMMCAFIDQYISCAIPSEEGKLKELVQLLQQHKHSSYVKDSILAGSVSPSLQLPTH
jgi:hypothetical protein